MFKGSHSARLRYKVASDTPCAWPTAFAKDRRTPWECTSAPIEPNQGVGDQLEDNLAAPPHVKSNCNNFLI